MPLPITLTEDEARELAIAEHNERRAQRQAEVAIAHARYLEAVETKTALLERLARTYGFDATQPVQFDLKSRTLVATNGQP